MVIGRFEPAVGSLGLGLMTTKPEPSWGRASLQASQHDINSKCCNLVGAFELSQCADCERPALSSVPPTVKAVAAKQSAAFLKSARSDQAPGPVTKARFAQVAKRWLALAREPERRGVPHSGRITAMGRADMALAPGRF